MNRGRGFPLKLFALAFFVSLVSTAFSGWLSWHAHRRAPEIARRHIQLTDAVGRLMQYDEVLTTSARMAAATGDFQYEDRYNEVVKQLTAVIAELRTILPQSALDTSIDVAKQSNNALVALERRSFALSHAGRRTEALALLTESDYLRLKEAYARNIAKTVSIANDFMKRDTQTLRATSLGFAVAAALATLVLLASWFLAARAARSWATERQQSEAALRAVRDELEQRVTQRTADIEATNAQLRELNHNLEQAHNQLLQSEKMASIGLLAAGVAHEINNPIGYVSSNLTTLQTYVQDLFQLLDTYDSVLMQLAQGNCPGAVTELKARIDVPFLREDTVALINESHQGIQRVKKIIADLKAFSRASDEDEWATADIHQGIESTLNVIWNELKYTCDVHKEYGELPLVECVLPQLNQVFMNLLVNAAQAIEKRGTIAIRTGSRDEEVWIEVADTGSGIPPEKLGNIFEPFFTTKPVGKGTGLGLSVSYNIVRKHHGRIEVESQLGKGSLFRVILPKVQPHT